MKEQYRPIELTNTGALPTLKAGDIFMDSQTEQPQVGPGAVSEPRRAPAAGYERFPQTLKSPELQSYVSKFSLKTALRPIGQWSRTDLFDEFNELSEIELKALESEGSYAERAKIAGMGWLYRGMLNNGLHAIDDREGVALEDRSEFSSGYISIPPSLEKTLGSFIAAPNEPDAREFIRDFMARVAEKPLSLWSQAELAQLHESILMLKAKMFAEGAAQGKAGLGRREEAAEIPVESVLQQEIENRRTQRTLQEEEWKRTEVKAAEKRKQAGYDIQVEGLGPGAPGPVVPPAPPAAPPSPDPTLYNPALANQQVLHDIAQEAADAITTRTIDQDRIKELTTLLDQARVAGRADPALARTLNQQLQLYKRYLGQLEHDAARQASEDRRLESGNLFQSLQADERRTLETGDPIKIREWLDYRFNLLYRQPVRGALAESREFTEFQNLLTEAKRVLQSLPGKGIFVNGRRFEQTDLDEITDYLNETFFTKYHAIVMQATIGFKGVDEILRSANNMKTHYLMNGFTLESGRVGAMYHRIDEYVEDIRLTLPQQHVTPEIIKLLQTDKSPLIDEQMKLARIGVGPFAELQGATDIKLKEAVIRALRTGYDIWVCTQRQSVIVARGRKLEGGTAGFRSDPIGALAIYNPQEFMSEKWMNRSSDVEKMMEQIQIRLADDYLESHPGRHLTDPERLDLGKRLYRDFINIPDFFSSSWRIDVVLDKVEERCKQIWGDGAGKAQAENLALFMRLIKKKDGRKPLDAYDRQSPKRVKERRELREELEEVWGKIATSQSDEIVRLFQDRVADDVSATLPPKINGQVVEELNAPEKRFPHSPRNRALYNRFHALFSNPVFASNGIRHYKEFKAKMVRLNDVNDANGVRVSGGEVPLASVLNAIRQEGYTKLRQVNFAELNQPENAWVRRSLEQAIGPQWADDVQKMYTAFNAFGQASIRDLIENDKFEDIYLRVLKTDDAMLQEVERKDFSEAAKTAIIAERASQLGRALRPGELRVLHHGNQKRAENAEFIPMSDMYSSDPAGDAYVRTWGDTKSAIEAIGTHLVTFLTTENREQRYKAAEAMAKSIVNYNGVENAVDGIYFTIGTHLKLGKLDFALDALGLKGRPFRGLASGLQRLYGPHADALGQDERREILDGLKEWFILAGETLSEDELKLSPAEQARLKHEKRERAAKRWNQMESIAEVKGRHYFKKRGVSFIVFLLLFLFAEGWSIADPLGAIQQKKK